MRASMSRALSAAHRRRAEGHVLDELEQHAAAAGHDHQAHFGVAVQAEHELEAAADLPADQHAGEAVPLQPLRHAVIGRRQLLGDREVERHRADVGLVQ